MEIITPRQVTATIVVYVVVPEYGLAPLVAGEDNVTVLFVMVIRPVIHALEPDTELVLSAKALARWTAGPAKEKDEFLYFIFR